MHRLFSALLSHTLVTTLCVAGICLVLLTSVRAQHIVSYQKISGTLPAFAPILQEGNRFGGATTVLGDLDGNGTPDLAVSAWEDKLGIRKVGAVYILFLNTNGAVDRFQKITPSTLPNHDITRSARGFGRSLAALGDLDGDGITELAVGASQNRFGGSVWILFLQRDGTVKRHHRLNHSQLREDGSLGETAGFGHALAHIGDLNGDGLPELAVWASQHTENGLRSGAFWILFLNRQGQI